GGGEGGGRDRPPAPGPGAAPAPARRPPPLGDAATRERRRLGRLRLRRGRDHGEVEVNFGEPGNVHSRMKTKHAGWPMLEHTWFHWNDFGGLVAKGLGETPDPRKLRLVACGCARRLWDIITDPRSRAAVCKSEAVLPLPSN